MILAPTVCKTIATNTIMNKVWKPKMRLNKTLQHHEAGQTVLESVLVLIVVLVVVSLFAFTIMSARSSTLENNNQSVQSHHEN